MTRRNDWFRAARPVAFAGMLFAGMAGVAAAQARKPLMCCLKPPTTYTLTDLSSSYTGTGWSFAYAIDGAGQAVGEFSNPGGAQDAFRTLAKKPINYYSTDDLGVLSGDYRSYGYAINASGVTVGTSVALGGALRSFRSSAPGAALEDLNSTSGTNTTILAGSVTDARGINDAGWIVGCFSPGRSPASCDDPWASTHSFVSFGPGWTESIDSWYGNPAFSSTLDINNNDQLAGSLRHFTTDPPTAFFFDAGAGVLRLTKIGTLPGGGMSVAYALNDSAQVVGSSQISTSTSYGTHAFLFQDSNNNGIVDAGELIDLDTMNTSYSAALGINGGGTAVGYYGDNTKTAIGSSRAAIFGAGGMIDLNTLVSGGTGGWTLRAAYGINDGGQIVGYMQNSSGEMHAFRLDPVTLIRLPHLPQ